MQSIGESFELLKTSLTETAKGSNEIWRDTIADIKSDRANMYTDFEKQNANIANNFKKTNTKLA